MGVKDRKGHSHCLRNWKIVEAISDIRIIYCPLSESESGAVVWHACKPGMRSF